VRMRFFVALACAAGVLVFTTAARADISYSVPLATVPDGGMTLLLLGGALVGLETLRRRFGA